MNENEKASHPAPAPIVGEREEQKHVHINLPSGGSAKVAYPPDSKLVQALDKMVQLAKEMPIETVEIKTQMPLKMPESVQKHLEDKIRSYHNPLSFKCGVVELWEYLAQLPSNTQYEASQPAPIEQALPEEEENTRRYFKSLVDQRNRELSAAREQAASARKLITDLRHGNYVLDTDDECERWLRENPETK